MPKPISYRIPNYVFRIRFYPQKTNSIGLNVENDCGSVQDISVSFSSLAALPTMMHDLFLFVLLHAC
jgi:hypothetical protein